MLHDAPRSTCALLVRPRENTTDFFVVFYSSLRWCVSKIFWFPPIFLLFSVSPFFFSKHFFESPRVSTRRKVMEHPETSASPPHGQMATSCLHSAPIYADSPPPYPRIPLRVVQVALVVVSLSLVGVLACVLTRANAEAALDRVSQSYRTLACTVVENEVVNYLTVMTVVARKLALYVAASTISPGNPTPVDLRKEIAFSMTVLTGKDQSPTSGFLGTPDGHFLGIDTDATTGSLRWSLSSAMTGFHFGSFPAVAAGSSNCTGDSLGNTDCVQRRVLWDTDWLSRVGEISVTEQLFNVTARLWYQTGAATTEELAFAPVYASVVPIGGVVGNTAVLSLPAVVPVRSKSGQLIAVAASECTVSHFDDFLKKISTSLLEGTVAFLVEVNTGYLLASSIAGQQMVSHFSPSGHAVRVLAVEASSEVIRAISRGLADPVTGWGDFQDQSEQVSAGTVGGYLVDVRRVNVQGLQWVMVVGTDARSWTAMVNHGLPLTLGLVALVTLGTALLTTLLVRLFATPLIRLTREVELLCTLDVVQMQPFPRSVYKEIDTLTQAFNTLTRSLGEYR
eukprot:RCo017126